jgi:hypothetical protein
MYIVAGRVTAMMEAISFFISLFVISAGGDPGRDRVDPPPGVAPPS